MRWFLDKNAQRAYSTQSRCVWFVCANCEYNALINAQFINFHVISCGHDVVAAVVIVRFVRAYFGMLISTISSRLSHSFPLLMACL